MQKEPIATNMREAFERISIPLNPSRPMRETIRKIHQSLVDGAGIIKRPSWNAHLSLKTYQELKARGIMV